MDRPDLTGLEQFTSGTLRRAIRCVAMLLERCNGPRRLRDIYDDDEKPLSQQPTITGLSLAVCKCDALIYYRNYVT